MAKWGSGELRFEGGKKMERMRERKKNGSERRCECSICVYLCTSVCVCVCDEKEKRCQREDYRKREWVCEFVRKREREKEIY